VAGWEGDFELPGPRTHPAALVYVAGPHRRFVNGLQSTFFHHALVSLLARFAASGYTAVCLNPPGSMGRGRSHREHERPWSVTTQEALAARIQALRCRGVYRIGVVTGSLGAVPTLHFLRTHPVAGAVLVSPVYHCDIAALARWQHLFDDAARETSPEELARQIRTPLLIVHGLRDEMAAAEHSSRFVAHLPADVPCDYNTRTEEGHIFAQQTTWEETLVASSRFLRERLLA
jgi:dipeptidyl aminopeptidase/acylaminoacyl peptidase